MAGLINMIIVKGVKEWVKVYPSSGQETIGFFNLQKLCLDIHKYFKYTVNFDFFSHYSAYIFWLLPILNVLSEFFCYIVNSPHYVKFSRF